MASARRVQTGGPYAVHSLLFGTILEQLGDCQLFSTDQYGYRQMEPRRRGRPPEFDRDQVLDAAVLVFWEKGYDGASISDLTAAMGIERPSLYAAFDNKRGLFVAAIDRYAATHGWRSFQSLLLDPDTRRAVADFFDTSIRCATEPGMPSGCMIASVATETAGNDTALRTKLARMFARTDSAIADRFRHNRQHGWFPDDQDPDALARMVHSVTHSIRIRARAGASRAELSEIADAFMAAFFPRPR